MKSYPGVKIKWNFGNSMAGIDYCAKYSSASLLLVHDVVLTLFDDIIDDITQSLSSHHKMATLLSKTQVLDAS